MGDEIHIKADAKVVIEAGSEMTIKAGEQWIRLDPSGIKTSPILTIGAGSPGRGSDAKPLLPAGRFTKQYVFLDQQTNDPIVGRDYLITTESGEEYRGVTDSAGKTERIYTAQEEQVSVTLV